MHVLTQIALDAFPDFLQRGPVALAAEGMPEEELASLGTLSANLHTKRTDPRVEALLYHLCLDAGLTGARIAGALPVKEGQRAALAAEIDAWIEANLWRIVGRAEGAPRRPAAEPEAPALNPERCARIKPNGRQCGSFRMWQGGGRSDYCGAHQPRAGAKEQEEPEMAKSGIERLAEVCERYPGILKRKIPGWVRDRLMDEAMISTATTFMPYVSDLRGRAGIAPGDLQPWSDPPGWGGAQEAATVTASTPPAPAAEPGEPEAAEIAAVAVSGQVSPPLVQGSAPQEGAGGEVAASTDMGEGWRLMSAMSATGYAQVHVSGGIVESGAANGHAPLSEAERDMALQLALGVYLDFETFGEWPCARRLAVLEKAARVLEAVLEA